MKNKLTRNKKESLTCIADELFSLYKSLIINVNHLMPVNFSSEYKKFMRSSFYNPQFIYKKQSSILTKTIVNKFKKRIYNLFLPHDLEQYFLQIIDHYLLLDKTKSSIGTPMFPKYAKHIFPFTKKDYSLISMLPKFTFANTSDTKKLSSTELQDFFRRYLSNHTGLTNITISIDYSNRYFIRASSDKLIIGSGVSRSLQDAIRLIIHEIESHILQKRNIYTSTPILKLVTYFDKMLYAEGVAVFNEIYTGAITKQAYTNYHSRLTATFSLQHSFRKIYKILQPHMSAHQAFITVFRAKRGLADTSLPGGWAKDACYLLGCQRINEYLQNGGTLSFLYKTRVPKLGRLLAKYNLLPQQIDTLLPPFLNA